LIIITLLYLFYLKVRRHLSIRSISLALLIILISLFTFIY